MKLILINHLTINQPTVSIVLQWAKEARESERMSKKKKMENEENAASNDLALAIRSRNAARASQAGSFFDALIDKYAKQASDESSKPKKAKTTSAKAKTSGRAKKK